MERDKRWNVTVDIDEHDTRTRARARLTTFDTGALVGVGLARLDPYDRDVPAIGDALAVARALSDLAHQLLDAAAADIERLTAEPAHLHM